MISRSYLRAGVHSHCKHHLQCLHSLLWLGKMFQHCGGEPEQTAHCADLCHATQTMNSGRVCDCLLSVRAATNGYACMGLSFTHKPWAESLPFTSAVCAWPLPEATCILSVSSLLQSLSANVHSWDSLQSYASFHACFNLSWVVFAPGFFLHDRKTVLTQPSKLNMFPVVCC